VSEQLAIVGTGHGHQLAPTTGEVWVLNDLGIYLPQCTMLWDMHDFTWTLEENFDNYSHVEEDLTEKDRWKRAKNRDARFRRIEKFCNETGCVLMSVREYDHIPTSIEYPLDDVIDYFPGCRDFLNSALSQAISYALYDGYDNIDLFGINVEMGTEWVYQRDCVSYWIGRGHGMGARITVSGSSRRPMRILDRKIYGYPGRLQRDCGEQKPVLTMPERRPIMVWDESGEEW
jgi:hypothetical protein